MQIERKPFRRWRRLESRSIDLKENNYNQTFIDGSSIDGQTIFTRTNGTTGTAATVTLVSEAAGHALQTTTSTDANGAVTVDNKALNPDGSLASETISVTSANGLSRTLSQDVDGDGVIDLIQTETTIVNGDGSKLTTLIDKTGGGVNLDNPATRAKKSCFTFSKSCLTAKATPLLFRRLFAMPAPFSGGIAGRFA